MQSNRTRPAAGYPSIHMLRLPALCHAAWKASTSRRTLTMCCAAAAGADSSSAQGSARRRRRAPTGTHPAMQESPAGTAEGPALTPSTSLSHHASTGGATAAAADQAADQEGSTTTGEAKQSRRARSTATSTSSKTGRGARSKARQNVSTAQDNTIPAAARAAVGSSTSTGSSSSSSRDMFAPEPHIPGQDRVKAWVVFSDLHVSTKTLGSCVEVLRRVHEEARRRQAGVLFLGDFWDRRGDLPVIPLNTIQQEMAAWEDTPLLLLPGNHDQVDLSGHHHALHPVAVAAQSVHVFTEPTLYRDSLWLPYRRDEGLIRGAIAAALQRGPLKAIFGHADVLTAHMNASYQARDGLPPDLFPQHTPVYLGHYHYPHTLPHTHMTYIGSPYQVTASEAGQQKRLLLLDTNWQQLDSLPLDIGRKFFSLSTPAAAASTALNSSSSSILTPPPAPPAAAAADAESDSAAVAAVGESAAAAAAAVGGGGGGVLQLDAGLIQSLLQQGVLKSGDLVHLKAEQDDESERSVREVVKLLSEQGVSVQVHRAPSSQAAARIDSAEQLSMAQLLEVYAHNSGMSGEVLTTARHALKELGSQSSATPRHSHLELEEVTVEGFGPFAQAISYPLCGRGVVAVTGLNRDDAAAVSNGAGKTSLLTSLLWAFKAPDGRKMTNADYINDGSKTARVTVTGRINTEPFVLTRTASKTKSSLQLVVSGVDVTQQEQRLTEEQLEARFSASLLPKTLVFTQEDLLGLLQSGDAAFKKMLSSVVDTDCWESAREAAAATVKALTRQHDMTGGVTQSLTAAVGRLTTDLQQQQQEEAGWEQRQQWEKASAVRVEQQGLQEAQETAAEAQRLVQVCSAASKTIVALQQGLDDAIAAAASRAAATATAAAAAVAVAAEAAAATHHICQEAVGEQQQQQQEDVVVLPEYDAGAAAAELQPLLHAEAAAAQQLQQQRGLVQELKGQLAAAAKRRHKYEKLQKSGRSGSSSGSSGSSGVAAGGSSVQHVCEQCLQPINVELYQRNLDNMGEDEQQLQQQLTAATAAEQQQEAALQAAIQQREQCQRQQLQQKQQVAAEREAVMAAMAAAAAARAREAEERRLQQQRQQQEQQARLAEVWREERQLSGLSQQLRSLQEGLKKGLSVNKAALQRLSQRLDLPLAQKRAPSSSRDKQPAADVILSSVLSAGGNVRADDAFSRFLAHCAEVQTQSHDCAEELREAVDAVTASRAKLTQLTAMSNPYSAAVQQLQRQLQAQQQELLQQQTQQEELAQKIHTWRRVEVVFGRTGIPSFLLEGVLGELQAASSRHLAHLAAGMTLELSATSSRKTPAAAAAAHSKKAQGSSNGGSNGDSVDDDGLEGVWRVGSISSSRSSRGLAGVAAAAAGSVSGGGAGVWSSTSAANSESESEEEVSSSSRKKGKRKTATAAAAAAVKEEISKIVRVQGAGGGLMQRSIAQLSGGEKKRVALALGLGFAEVVAARGRLTSNALILDEVLEKLDDEGCSRVAWLLKGLPYDSVFVVGQAGSFVTKEFAAVDTVVKEGGRSFVELGGDGPAVG